MGRKNTCRATKIENKPLMPVKDYLVHLKSGLSVPVKANHIREDGDTLILECVMYNSKDDEIIEIRGMFKEWESIIDAETIKHQLDVVNWGKKFESLAKTE